MTENIKFSSSALWGIYFQGMSALHLSFFFHCESSLAEKLSLLGLISLKLLGKKSKQVLHTRKGKENRKRQKVSQAEKERELTICSQHDELVITEILGPNPESRSTNSKTVPAHPHFGGKQPKQHQPPKCISVLCKEEKTVLEDQSRDARQELEDMEKELDDARRELQQAQAELSESKLMTELPILVMF